MVEMNNDIFTAIIKSILPETEGIYLFGSYGTEYQTAESDIDIALLIPFDLQNDLLDKILLNIQNELAIKSGHNIDLVNLRKVSTVFQFEIISNGKLIYSSDQAAVEEFELLVMSLYNTLNIERRDILREIESTGRILA